jgi:nitrate reductase gamma subunit
MFLVVFPYTAVAVFAFGVAYRYRHRGFTVSSLSSQFLEGRQLFWGSVPFHLGILVVLLVHAVAMVLPGVLQAWVRDPVRLLALEAAATVFGMSVLVGLLVLVYRRVTSARIRAVTTTMDAVVLLVLVAQVGLGLWVALRFRWGYAWFAADVAPYLWSLVRLTPDTAAVSTLPLPIKLHIVGAFAIVLLVPFTRLVHFLVTPLHYLVRPCQRVLWNWDRKAIRDPQVPWSRARPTNN